MRRLLAAACACACTIAAASSAWAGDLSSASFTSRGGHVSASGNVGQSEAVGPTGATTTLTSQAGGFWPIAVGAFPTLDFDHDGRQAFLDPDDDNDGLADTVESGTGVFVSASDTGSNPNATDTDGDGFGDLVRGRRWLRPQSVRIARHRDPEPSAARRGGTRARAARQCHAQASRRDPMTRIAAALALIATSLIAATALPPRRRARSTIRGCC
jgi:hypothetical protein